MLPKLPPRRTESHKGDFGHALLVGGSRNMPGAIGLAAAGALRGGAGLVTVATAESAHAIVAGLNPCAMTARLPEDAEGRISIRGATIVARLAQRATCVAIGPGLGQSPELTEWIRRWYLETTLPMVLDADAIHALAEPSIDFGKAAGPRILTPHVGEFRRLVGSNETSRQGLELQARQFAAMTGAIVLLKGHHSIVTSGEHEFRNTTGNPAMATGGCGDVLTGLIAALVCQKLSPWEATCLGTWVHGAAGDLAAAEIGPVGIIASDVADRIPAALQQAVRAH
jgi:NAD(P)H-hydrate epimerase